jgi:hypothetical protein
MLKRMLHFAAQAAAAHTHADSRVLAHSAVRGNAAADNPRLSRIQVPVNFGVRTALLTAMTVMSAGCIVTLLPGAAQVKVTTDAADIAGCTDVGNVAGIGGDIGNIYRRQMQNQAVAMDADTVFRSGNGGIAYRCKGPTPGAR